MLVLPARRRRGRHGRDGAHLRRARLRCASSSTRLDITRRLGSIVAAADSQRSQLCRGRPVAGHRRWPQFLQPRPPRPAAALGGGAGAAAVARKNEVDHDQRNRGGTARPCPAATPDKRNIIAVASGKGGVGKTWFAITLAHALARAGRKALLFDGDLGLANVDVQLGCTPRRDLASVVAGEYTLAQAATPHSCGFDIIAGRSGSGNLASMPASRLARSARRAAAASAQGYDWVVLDLGAGIERTVRLLTAQSRACLVVTTDEPTAITDAYAYIKVTALERLADGIQIVVNMAAQRSATASAPMRPCCAPAASS